MNKIKSLVSSSYAKVGALALMGMGVASSAFAQTFGTTTDSQDALLNEVVTNAGDRLLHVLYILVPIGLAFWGIYYVWRHGWGFLFGRTH